MSFVTKNARFSIKQLRVSLAAALMLVAYAIVLLPGQSLAWSGAISNLASNNLDTLAWPYQITNNPTCSGTCYKDPAFSATNSSYVIGYDPTPPGGLAAPGPFGPYNCGVGWGVTRCFNYVIYWSDSCQLEFVGDGSSTYHLDAGGCNYNYMDLQHYAGSYWGSTTHVYMSTVNAANGNSASITTMTGVWAVHNVTYVNWDQPFFSKAANYGSGGGAGSTQCSALDFGCWMGSIWSTIGNDFSSVGQAIVQSLASLFVPNGAQLNSDWTSFYSTLSTKLGFLLWPFTFVGGLFSAMVTPTTTCCTIGAGTIFGAHWSGINLIYVETANPDIWSLATTVIRAATILLLFLFLRDKFLEITHK